MLVELIRTKAITKGLLNPDEEIDSEKAFTLVRDMPYTRASTRDPETIINEWRGTCSGKHYLLKALFAELGYKSRLIACTSVSELDPDKYWGKLRKLVIQSKGRFVDVHNFLVLDTPKGEMVVDATWPITTKGMGTVVNETFVLGEDQKTAAESLESWTVPEDVDPQEFKNQILQKNFTPEELEQREEFIKILSRLSNNKITRLLMWLHRFVKGP